MGKEESLTSQAFVGEVVPLVEGSSLEKCTAELPEFSTAVAGDGHQQHLLQYSPFLSNGNRSFLSNGNEEICNKQIIQ